MSQPRKRVFGPLLYMTLAFAAGVFALMFAINYRPIMQQRNQWNDSLVELFGADATKHEIAAQRIAGLGEDVARPIFLKLAADPRANLRALAYRHLAGISARPDQILPMLLAAAEDSDVMVRVEATRGLGIRSNLLNSTDPLVLTQNGIDPKMKEQVIAALNRRLADPESMVQVEAVSALGQYGGSPEYVQKLKALLDDKDRTIRLRAAMSLMLVLKEPEEPRSIQTLLSLLGDPEAVADRIDVLHALMGSTEAVQDRAAAVLASLLGEVEDSVRPDIVDCLVAMGPRAKAALPDFEKTWAKEEDPIIKASVGMMIARLEGTSQPRSIEILSALVANPSFPESTRLAAMGFLNQSGPAVLAKLSSKLVEQLAHPSSEVRRVAAALLQTVVTQVPAELPEPKPQE